MVELTLFIHSHAFHQNCQTIYLFVSAAPSGMGSCLSNQIFRLNSIKLLQNDLVS